MHHLSKHSIGVNTSHSFTLKPLEKAIFKHSMWLPSQISYISRMQTSQFKVLVQFSKYSSHLFWMCRHGNTGLVSRPSQAFHPLQFKIYGSSAVTTDDVGSIMPFYCRKFQEITHTCTHNNSRQLHKASSVRTVQTQPLNWGEYSEHSYIS